MNVHLAAEAGVIVVSVAYRLAPKFPFPHGLNDSFDVLSWVRNLPPLQQLKYANR